MKNSTCLAVVFVVTVILIPACGKKKSRPEQAPIGASSSPNDASGTESIDWSSVRPADKAAAMKKFQHLARYVDYEFNGDVTSVVVQITNEGVVMANEQQIMEMSLADWKGIAGLISGSPRLEIRAGNSMIYNDGLGTVDRYKYRSTMDEPNTLTLQNIGRHG